MYQIFIELLKHALKQQNYEKELQRLIDDMVVNIRDGEPLKLKTICYILERHSDYFKMTIGNLDEDIPLSKYMINHGIQETMNFLEFYTNVRNQGEYIGVHDLIEKGYYRINV